MTEPSMETFIKAPKPVPPPPPPGLIPDGAKTVLLFIAIAAVAYLIYDGYQFQHQTQAEVLKLAGQIQALENKSKVGEAKLSNLAGDIQETQQQVGTTKAELKKTSQQTQQAQVDVQKTKSELSQAISSKADASQVQAQVQAVKSEAEARIGQVNNEVGGVKTEVGAVKTDLANTKRDLEGTQRQLIDVRETLTAAVAKNSGEIDVLRKKGERNYTEFEIPKKNEMIKVEDIRLILTKTDPKKGKYNLQIVVDDNKLEKKDRTVNEPVQFLVGRNHLRYEVVINWVQKEKAGGYLSIPKDKNLSQERPTK